MIAGLQRAFDSLLGRGEAAVTVPPLDGAFRANRALDEAQARVPLADVDCLANAVGALLASAGNQLFELGADGNWKPGRSFDAAIACVAPVGADGLAVAIADGRIIISGGRLDGRDYRIETNSITALAATDTDLFVAVGSATNPDWQRDLMERNASGSIWRIELEGGTTTKIAGGLAWPAGIAVSSDGLVFSEAWKHQLVRIGRDGHGPARVLLGDLPFYPGRLSPAAGGWWLALFAPRSQLVEFVLREPGYRRRMLAEVPQPYWVSPKLRSGRDFHESLQGGGVKHLGMLKPWAPTMSAGLCVWLDANFQPRVSLHSRADGATHGVTCAVEHDGRLFVAAKGDGVVVSLPGSGGVAA